MSENRTVILQLHSADLDMVSRLQQLTRVSRSQLLRWSLRYYCLFGPWTSDIESRIRVVGDSTEPIEVGPGREDSL